MFLGIPSAPLPAWSEEFKQHNTLKQTMTQHLGFGDVSAKTTVNNNSVFAHFLHEKHLSGTPVLFPQGLHVERRTKAATGVAC